MRYSDDILEEIRARLPVSTIIGRRVDLKRRGREFVGLSPFNSEKTPSFTVNDQKGFYHCFSSGKHGDIFRFLMETEGLHFGEAVERLAGEAGVELPKYDPKQEEKIEKKRALSDVMALAQNYFAQRLHRDEGAYSLGYLSDRGVMPSVQQEFGLGYSLEKRDALKSFLVEQGVTEQEMKDTGLIIFGDDIAVSYDRFRNRLMFPIHDIKGRCIGFGGRALSEDQPAKYLNSPETEIFHKGQTLYNIHRARKAVFEGHDLIVAEGYMDVIALSQAGFKGAVAPLGTALTEAQLQLLWRFSDNPCLCLDGDKAGQKAAFRALELALPRTNAQKTMSFMILPEGQDPDDLIKNQGAEAIERIFQQKKTVFEMLLMMENSGQLSDSPEKSAAFEVKMKSHIGKIKDGVLQSHYVSALRDFLFQNRKQHFTSSRNYGQAKRAEQYSNLSQRQNQKSSLLPSQQLLSSDLVSGVKSKIPYNELILLAIPFYHHQILSEIIEPLADINFNHPDAQTFTKALLNQASHEDIILEDLSAYLRANDLGHVIKQLEAMSKLAPFQFLSAKMRKSASLRIWFNLVTRFQTLQSLNLELKEAALLWGEDPSEENQNKLIELKLQSERMSHEIDTGALISDEDFE